MRSAAEVRPPGLSAHFVIGVVAAALVAAVLRTTTLATVAGALVPIACMAGEVPGTAWLVRRGRAVGLLVAGAALELLLVAGRSFAGLSTLRLAPLGTVAVGLLGAGALLVARAARARHPAGRRQEPTFMAVTGGLVGTPAMYVVYELAGTRVLAIAVGVAAAGAVVLALRVCAVAPERPEPFA